ncbi:hypothetical protein CCP2SC5_240001 [Azospirillaceae bacterium]
MRVGVPTEVKNSEFRVAVTPAGGSWWVGGGAWGLVRGGGWGGLGGCGGR